MQSSSKCELDVYPVDLVSIKDDARDLIDKYSQLLLETLQSKMGQQKKWTTFTYIKYKLNYINPKNLINRNKWFL